MRSPVESAPFRTLADANGGATIEPPAGGRGPVSTSVAFSPAMVALTATARPLKVVTPGVGGGVGVGVPPGVGVGVGFGGVGVGVGVTVPHRTRIKMA